MVSKLTLQKAFPLILNRHYLNLVKWAGMLRKQDPKISSTLFTRILPMRVDRLLTLSFACL